MPYRYSVLLADGVVAAFLLTLFLWMQAGSLPVFQQSFDEVSSNAAESLAQKIVSIRMAESDVKRDESLGAVIEVTEIELESFLLYQMEDDIPAKVESIDVEIGVETISALTSLTFSSETTGNFMLDFLMGGTHRLFVEGHLKAQEGRGKFELIRIRVGEVVVPLVLVEALVDTFVNPRYPQVDLSESFDVPWGIEKIELTSGVARITY